MSLQEAKQLLLAKLWEEKHLPVGLSYRDTNNQRTLMIYVHNRAEQKVVQEIVRDFIPSDVPIAIEFYFPPTGSDKVH